MFYKSADHVPLALTGAAAAADGMSSTVAVESPLVDHDHSGHWMPGMLREIALR